EEFGEHGMVGWHSHSLYDELLRVPLVLKLPHSQLAGTSVETQVRSIDIAPTVLSALGIDIPLQFQGANLLEARGEEPFPSYAVSKQDVAGTEDVSALRTREWKWYRGKLFHLASDERERFDVSSSHPVMAEELRLKLQEIVASRPRPKATKVRPSEELEERLRSLGYIK
ncbi:MAG: sulfatase/phosphatase domain-containing protein, partial [Acidobacteriota bacterium]